MLYAILKMPHASLWRARTTSKMHRHSSKCHETWSAPLRSFVRLSYVIRNVWSFPYVITSVLQTPTRLPPFARLRKAFSLFSQSVPRCEDTDRITHSLIKFDYWGASFEPGAPGAVQNHFPPCDGSPQLHVPSACMRNVRVRAGSARRG